MLQQDAVLERLRPALDLALGLWVAWGTPDVHHAPALKPRGQITRDVTRPLIGEQPRPVHDLHLIEP